MKVAYLLGSLNRGGTETLLLDVFKNASQVDFEFIGIHRKGGILQSIFYETGVKMFQLTPRSKFDLTYLRTLRKLLLNENVDVVHAQQSLDALYAKIACIGTEIQVVQTIHGYDNINSEKKDFLFSYIIRHTDKNIYVSFSQRDYYIEKYKLNQEKQSVVYNGISFDKFDKALKSNIREELSIPKDMLLLGSVGNFTPVRDQFTLCRFCKLLSDNKIGFRFLLIGSKTEHSFDLYDQCVRFVEKNDLEDKVLFLGSRDDVPSILKQLDAFLYSTNHDTFGIAVIEAIYSAIPTFVNDWDVMNEITEKGKLATLYKTKDEKDLLNHFLLFLKNKEEYILKSEKASKIVLQKYSIENHIKHLQKIYSEKKC